MNISLSQGKEAIINDEDYEKVKEYKWSFAKAYKGKDKDCEYAVTYKKGATHKTRKRIYLHRFIMNAEKGQWVDHKDGNGLNCKKENLRFCTNSQNQSNRKARVNKLYSKFKGVSMYKNTGKYTAAIKKDGKMYNLGTFDTQELASKTYNKFSKLLFGEFSKGI